MRRLINLSANTPIVVIYILLINGVLQNQLDFSIRTFRLLRVLLKQIILSDI